MSPPVSGGYSGSADDYDALLQFLYLAPVGLVQTDSSGQILLINPLSSRLLMPLVPDGDLTNLFSVLQDVLPDLRHRIHAFDQPHGMVCDALRVAMTAGDREGSMPQTLSFSLLKLDDTRLMAVLSDVTEQVRQERLLRQNEAWLNAILNDIRDYCLVSLDPLGRIDDWNPGIGRITGFTREQVMGRSYDVFYPAGQLTPERMHDLLSDADSNGWSLDDGWRVRADGSRFWGSTLISPLTTRTRLRQLATALPADPTVPADAAGYCLVIRDIHDKRDASESHRRAVACDHLTGIANRRTFFEAGELELARARRSERQLSLILIDADHFKRVNDTHGHPAGDAVLQHLASMLTETFGAIDLVARIGGEEFAVLLPATDIDGALTSAERLRLAVQARPVEVGGQSIRYTVSAGVATGCGASLALADLIERADTALYLAKAGGRDRVAASAPN